MRERNAARILSAEIDRLMQGESGHPQLARTSSVRVLTDPIEAAHRVVQLRDRLPPAPADLERRVRTMANNPAVYRQTVWQRTRPTLWGALAATALLLLLWAITPNGQVAWAKMLSSLRLGQSRVALTPTIAPASRAVRQPLRDLLAAELLLGRAPAVPKTLPDGYSLHEIAAVSYPDLPSWISQPFFLELCYGMEGAPSTLWLRQYRLLFREYGGITGFEVASDKVSHFEQVEVAGVPGTLLTISGQPETISVLWERDGRLLELASSELTQDELLRTAQTIR